MPRSQNAKTTSKKHDQKKIVTYVQNAGMLELKQYLKRHKNADLNFRVDGRGRTVLHIAGILGDDGIIRTLLDCGADPKLVDTNGDTACHLAAKWCSRAENYANFKLVMTPFFKANPALAYHKNNDNESPQDILNAGKLRAAQAAEELKEAEDQREEAIVAREKKAKEESEVKMKELEFAEKLQNANDEDNNGDDILFQQAEWLKEEIKETFDDWADRIAREYADKRERYNRQNTGTGSKRTATGGIGAGKRGKEGRKNRKERERLEYIDHKKRRVDNYIRAQESAKEEKKIKQKEDYTKKVENMRKGEDILAYQDIPWPCDGTIQDMVEVMLADAPLTEPQKYRKIIHRQQLIWHPDKFQQRTGDRLEPKDKDKILITVQHLSQALNKALEKCDLA